MFTGVQIENGQTAEQPDFDMNLLEFTPAAAQGATKSLNASLNAGVEYKVWREKIGIGLLYTARFWEFKTRHSLTGSVNFQPARWFTLTGSYTVIDNRGGVVGLAMNLSPGWINFFVATDLLTMKHTPQWVPVRKSAAHLTLGLGIPIGRHGIR